MKRNVLEGNRPKESSYNPPKSPFSKGGYFFSSLWQREVERDFTRKFQTAKVTRIEEQLS
jgi:hypothetical protein